MGPIGAVLPSPKNLIRRLQPHSQVAARPLPSAPMRISRKLAALAAFFVVGAAVAGCGSSIPGNSVANIAGNPITIGAFNHWMYVAAKDQAAQYAEQGESVPVIVSSNPTDFTTCIKNVRAAYPTLRKTSEATLKKDCKQLFTSSAAQVMQFLVEGYWYQGQAHKEGVTAPNLNKDFNKYIKKQWPTDKAFQTYLKSSGQTRDDLLFQYRVETLYMKLVKKFTTPITTRSIAAYYAAHKSSFGTPESRDLHLIRTKSSAQAQAAVNALKSGQSWDTVAKTYAADATSKTNGGQLSGVTSGEEEAAVNTAIFANPVNKVVGPIKGVFGYYVLENTKITPAVQQSLAKATTAIKTSLTTANQTAAETKVAKLAKASFFKRSICRTEYAVQTVCANYKAPKTTTTATPTPTTTATTSTTATLTKTATTATKTSTTK